MRYYVITGLSIRDIIVASHGDESPIPIPDRPADFGLQITPDDNYHR